MNTADNMSNSYFRSKRIARIVLAVTAIICSRVLFIFFKDPEGPNLFVVAGLASALFFLSLAAYVFTPFKINGTQRLVAAVGVQILLAIVLFFCMR